MAFLSEEDRLKALLALDPRLAAAIGRVQAPQVVQATPSTPLPVTPVQGAVVAPASEQVVVPSAPPAPQPFDEFAPARVLLNNSPKPAGTGNAVVDKILQNNFEAQQRSAQNLMTIMSQAQMSPEEKQIIEDRKARIQAARERTLKDEKGAGWDALAKASAALMMSKGRFGQALGEASAIGMDAYDKARQAARDKLDALGASEDEAKLAMIKGRQAAQDRALAVYNAALAAGKTDAEARSAALRDAETQATMPQRMQLADLSVSKAEADLANTKADTYRTLHPVRSGGGDGDGGKPPSPTAILEESGKIVRDIGPARQAAADAYYAWANEKDPVKKAQKKSLHEIAAANYRRLRDRLAILEGRKPGSPFKAKPASAKPASGSSASGIPKDVADKYGL